MISNSSTTSPSSSASMSSTSTRGCARAKASTTFFNASHGSAHEAVKCNNEGRVRSAERRDWRCGADWTAIWLGDGEDAASGAGRTGA